MECVELRPCSDFADRYRFGKFLFCNDLSTQHAKYCGTNCPHVVGTVKNLRNTASTLPNQIQSKIAKLTKKVMLLLVGQIKKYSFYLKM